MMSTNDSGERGIVDDDCNVLDYWVHLGGVLGAS